VFPSAKGTCEVALDNLRSVIMLYLQCSFDVKNNSDVCTIQWILAILGHLTKVSKWRRDTPLTIKVTDTHNWYCQRNGHVSL
jgi:hypothetical protein